MTIVEFPDGRIVEFPTGTPEPVIKQMVADFIFPPPAPAPSLPAADDVMPEAEVFLEPDVLEPEEPAALLEPAPPEQALAPPAVLPLVARFRLTPYTDDENLLGTVPAMSPRERAERLQAEMKRKHVPVRNNSKGNMFTPRAATPSQVPVRRFARGDD
jgi:hypothetical protein